jgi:membrane protein DedA with SNARE-associated domain
VPGVRALAPAIAGALRLPLPWVTVMIASASAIWYGLITVVAFRVGTDWEQLRGTVTRYGTTAAVIGAGILAVGAAAWLIARNRRKTS